MASRLISQCATAGSFPSKLRSGMDHYKIGLWRGKVGVEACEKSPMEKITENQVLTTLLLPPFGKEHCISVTCDQAEF